MKYLNSFHSIEIIKYSDSIVRESIRSKINFREDE